MFYSVVLYVVLGCVSVVLYVILGCVSVVLYVVLGCEVGPENS